ncbi:MAG TPA: hypothetical protein DEB70_11215 [Planctomycetaceae bacterium]|nr:hypothetical protein [Planctomycetaceae bacterium]
MENQVIHSQPSFVLANEQISVAITKRGGHMAPVIFKNEDGQQISPYYISPWQDEEPANLPAEVLVPLRGDFFCMPFGGNAIEYKGEKHPPHGETATAVWSFVDEESSRPDSSQITLALDTHIRKGRVTKEIFLRERHPVVYQRHTVEGFVGPTSVGHHAILAMPDEKKVFAISTSPFSLGMTNPGVFSDPYHGEYQLLAVGKTFSDIKEIPTLFKDPDVVDCSRLPIQRGFSDLFAVVADTDALDGRPAWTTAVNTKEHWVWFSLRDPRTLPMTAFWLENHGRHSFPWSGRNQCLGVEDICGYFAVKLAASANENTLSEQGIATSIACSDATPTDIRNIQGAVSVPATFDRVKEISFGENEITLLSESGQVVTVPLNYNFVLGEGRAP